jgi:hypothetical protein
MQARLTTTKLEQRLQMMAKSIRPQWSIQTSNTSMPTKSARKWKSFGNGTSFLLIGKADISFADDRFGNAWLYNPSLLKPDCSHDAKWKHKR